MRKSLSILAASALMLPVSSNAFAQDGIAGEFRLIVVDGVKLPYVPGLMDSLNKKHYTIDSTTTPHRARIKTGAYTPSGYILMPLMEEIASAEVIRPAPAIRLYGDAAAMGAIAITTKKPAVVGTTIRGSSPR